MAITSIFSAVDLSKEISPTVFFALLCLLRVFVSWPFVRFFLWFNPSDPRSASAAASLNCQAHGGPIACLSLYLLFQTFKDGRNFDLSLPFSEIPATLQPLAASQANFLSAYMAYDTLFMLINYFLVYGPGSEPLLVPYCQHHLACLFYASSVRYYGAGHVSLQLLVFLGECTNPLQNLHSVAEHGAHFFKTSKPWGNIRRSILPVFALFFALIRFVVGPLVCVYFCWHYFYVNVFVNGSDKGGGVPPVVGALWTILFILVVHGSIPFGMEKLRDAGMIGEKQEKGKKKPQDWGVSEKAPHGKEKKGSKRE